VVMVFSRYRRMGRAPYCVGCVVVRGWEEEEMSL
jgi:hypothetical protein